MKRTALYLDGKGSAELREEQLDGPAEGQVLVQALVSSISSGTEMLFFRNQVPSDLPVDSSIATLAADLSYPLKYGYCSVGLVSGLGRGVPADWLGKRVFAFNPHETHFLAEPASLMPLPEDINAEAAAFLPNMETAVNFVMDGRPMIGDQVAVLGQGIVGLLTTALLARMPVASLVTLDRLPLRREWSLRLGAAASLDPARPGVAAEARQRLRGDRPFPAADLTFELSGAPEALNLAIELTGFDGTVLIGSWYGQKRAEINLGGAFHRSRIRLVSSQVSTINPAWQGRWSKDRRFALAWEMIREIHPEQLITQRIAFEKAPDAYQLLDQTPEETLQVVLTYD